MQVGSIIAIFFVVWWLCLFMILPIRARSQSDAGEVVHGTEPGAPAVLRMWPKLLATTLLAAVLTALLFWGLSNPVLREYWR
jgi:predicted secreted protein